MTQITINQWLSNNTTTGATMPRYQIATSLKFHGHYDILDTKTGKRVPQGTTSIRWIQYEVNALNSKSIIKQEKSMNEYKHLSNTEVNALYKRAKASVKDLSPFMATNDRLYLQQQLVKLRQEVLRRLDK